MEFESQCSLMTSTSMSERWTSRMPQGLDLEISQHPLTMKSVVNLIIAMERLKDTTKSESPMSSEFRDEDLLNIMLESAVEEEFVFEVTAAPPAERQGKFNKTGEHEYSITDTQKRNWVLVKDAMELHALMLQGGSSHRKVNLNMCTYVNTVPSTDARPVILGIRGTDLYLSCSEENGRPTLHLEEVQGKEWLRSISKGTDMVRFLFYKRDSGLDISTFMSAHFPGWYISTAQEDDRRVDMCQQTAERYRNFTIQRQN
ncbi:interleukin-1 beta-like [Lampris incognitus]|uniref:interleukin-1 beta-like n=1 Tax=Lampris incognitus TaxID=2546036 RepID=UPI0024B592FD|nr:interleukin-1 beta-like [Lampris incognitus]